MNDTVNDTIRAIETPKVPKLIRYNISVFANLIETKKEIYLSRRDSYAEANDDINMRYYDAKADACQELLYTINSMF